MAIDIEAWYKKYGPMVIRRCQRILGDEEEALDAVHDVFVNLLKGELRLHGQFPSSLLYTIATNICLNRLRKRKRETITDFSGEDEGEAGSTIDTGFEQVEAQMLMEVILKDESEMNRTICFMYHVDGMTLKEIGEAVGLSFSGVRKRLEAFRNRAKIKLEDI
ncbi:MAG: sigma-70 family RNA polymerase sigma factor [Treponema sp.]|jgi:RNA polymerase sigma-70 factor (ECF subfamily)|nr:sigma-70 family RNA polymerase sigma factor [Treponema sp.]